MAVPGKIDVRGAPYIHLDCQRQQKQLSIVREQSRHVSQRLFEVCCKLQKQFDPKDLEEASVLVAELRTLKACQEELEHSDSLGL